ncbi:MAG: RsmD family RNA methyltransferase, partial [Pseudobutyrivibrio sp.]|uniref:RsmD family RNA methyltransferase n=1 Tax=Pseudobutyrivibrio sp. TaxID=2014367 RepID=UPI0025EFF7C4
MRVIAGNNRGLNLQAPEGLDTRPTTDRIKETLFNMIAFDLPDANFLDLFAGSGQIGIEALSRGAKEAVFVEKDKKAYDCIEKNLIKAKLTDKASVLKTDIS